MKTMSEIQSELKNIEASIVEISKDIFELDNIGKKETNSDKFDEINVIAKRNPILLHPIVEKDEFIQRSYFVILASSLIVSKNDCMDSWLFLQRIMCATDVQDELSEISVEASCMNSRQLDEITYSIMNNNLSEIFAFDLLLLHLLSNDKSAEYLEYVSELLQLINLDKNSISDLSSLARIVVEQNSNDYSKFSKKNNSVNLPNFYCYLKTIQEGIMANNDGLLWINNTIPYENLMKLAITEEEQIFFGTQKISKLSARKILFENATIDIPEEIVFSGNEIKLERCNINLKDKGRLNFKNCGSVVLKDCVISNEGYTIYFTECKSITFENSSFKGNDERKCFYAASGDGLRITGCSFIDFSSNEKKEYQYGAYFGCCEIKDILSVEFNNSKFKNCQSKHWERGKADCAVGGIYGTDNIVFHECEFNNCKNRVWKYAQTWEDRGYMFEFDKGVKPDFSTCKFDNCVKQFEENR